MQNRKKSSNGRREFGYKVGIQGLTKNYSNNPICNKTPNRVYQRQKSTPEQYVDERISTKEKAQPPPYNQIPNKFPESGKFDFDWRIFGKHRSPEVVKKPIIQSKSKSSNDIKTHKRKPSKVTHIIIDKNAGKIHKFRPLEKLEEKKLNEEDSMDSIDLSLSYGPAHFEEEHLIFNDGHSTDEKQNKRSNIKATDSSKRYDEPSLDDSRDEILKLDVEQTNFNKNQKSSSKTPMTRGKTDSPNFKKNTDSPYKRRISENSNSSKNMKKSGRPLEVTKKATSKTIYLNEDSDEDSVLLKISSYRKEEVEDFQKILKQPKTPEKIQEDSKPMRLNSKKKSPAKTAPKGWTRRKDLENKQKIDTKAFKHVELEYDSELDNSKGDEDQEFLQSQNSEDSSYEEVIIEHDDHSYINKKDNSFGLEGFNYSKTFANHLPEEVQVNTNHDFSRQKLKPWLKKAKSTKNRRFRSPDMNIERLEPSNKFDRDKHQRNKEAYKRMRRRPNNNEHSKKSRQEDEEETEMLKQEYIRLKQQLIELQRKQPKRNNDQSKSHYGQNTHRNYDKEENEIRVDYDQRHKNKFVRFNIEELEKRGKTPTHIKHKSQKFYFDNEESDDESISRMGSHKLLQKQGIKRVESQYNDNRQSNSLLIWKINKVENLKIVHRSDQKHRLKTSKTKPSSRRGSAGFDLIPPKFYNPNKENTTADLSHRPIQKRDLSQSKSISNLNNVSATPGCPPRHQKNMKSDNLRPYKFTTVNWLNHPQPVMDVGISPSLYANNPISNILLYQHMTNFGIMNDSQFHDVSQFGVIKNFQSPNYKAVPEYLQNANLKPMEKTIEVQRENLSKKTEDVIDSLNVREATGVKGIERGRLGRSDFELNDRESVKFGVTEPVLKTNKNSDLLHIPIEPKSSNFIWKKKLETRQQKRSKSTKKRDDDFGEEESQVSESDDSVNAIPVSNYHHSKVNPKGKK
jgi:hypothetical protein